MTKQEIRGMWQAAKNDANCDRYFGKWWSRTMFQFIRLLFLDAQCRLRGHNWEDQSTVGPDSGDIHLVCLRCGCSEQTILY